MWETINVCIKEYTTSYCKDKDKIKKHKIKKHKSDIQHLEVKLDNLNDMNSVVSESDKQKKLMTLKWN